MVEVQIKTILESSPSLREINNLDLPIKVALKWNKMVKEIDEVLKLFNEKREALFNEYAVEQEVEPDEEGKAPAPQKVVPEEKMDEFGGKINELIDEEVELNIQKLHASTFGNIRMKPAVLAQLEWIFADE
jgi:hypothetical protein